MKQDQTDIKKNKRYGTIVVIIMMVLGGGILLMSRAGLQRYKSLKAELKVYPDSLQVIAADFTTQSGKEISSAIFKGKIIIAHFYDPKCEDCTENVWKELKRVQDEYKKKTTRRVQLLSYSLTPDSISNMRSLLTKHSIDTTNWRILTTDSSSMLKVLKKGYRLDFEKAKTKLALLDINGFIVNYYDPTKTEEINLMMRHMAMLIPAKKDRRKLKYKKENNFYE